MLMLDLNHRKLRYQGDATFYINTNIALIFYLYIMIVGKYKPNHKKVILIPIKYNILLVLCLVDKISVICVTDPSK